jgi:uncharacterized protein (TIGR03083 family)
VNGHALADPDRLLHVLGDEAERLAARLPDAPLEAIVPGCPGLTLGETARHVGSVHRMVWHWLRDGARPGEWQRSPRPGQDLAAYVRAGVAPLLVELAAHRPDEICQTWWPADQTYGFWRRRMAHETIVHRIDVQGAAGGPIDDVDDDIALDGIDEVLTLWFEHRLAVLNVTATRDHVVTIRTGGREWVAHAGLERNHTHRPVDPAETDPDAGNGEGATHAVVTGSPMRVYLWLWGRRSSRTIEQAGSLDAVAQLWALLRLATR